MSIIPYRTRNRYTDEDAEKFTALRKKGRLETSCDVSRTHRLFLSHIPTFVCASRRFSAMSSAHEVARLLNLGLGLDHADNSALVDVIADYYDNRGGAGRGGGNVR